MTNRRNTGQSEITAYIGLGSNLGDRAANLREAVARIEQRGVELLGESSIYETEPVGYSEQRWFLNQVIEARISEDNADLNLSAGDAPQAELLLGKLLTVEREMGRVRAFANGPRIIDIDLLFFGGIVIRSQDVIVPHPRLHLRRFVLEPLCEIAPELVHPALMRTCREILSSLDDPAVVRLYDSAG